MENIPPIGLPKTLEVMLEQLLKHNPLKGWSMYQNKYKNLCLCIRFDSDSAIQSGSMSDLACSYRRQNSKQQQRNIQRVQAFNSKKRKLDTESNSPENIRIELFKSPTACIDTPVSLERVSPEVLRRSTTPDLRRSTTPVSAPSPDSVTPDHGTILTPHPILEYAYESHIDQIHSESITMLPDDKYMDYESVATVAVTESVERSHATTNPAFQAYEAPPPIPTPATSNCIISENCDSVETSLSSSLIRCPCCDRPMEVGHMCDEHNNSSSSIECDSVVSGEYDYTVKNDAAVKEYDSAAVESVECVRDLSVSTKADEYEIPPDEFSMPLPPVPPKIDNWFLKEQRLQIERAREAEIAKYHALHTRLHHK